jgi:hypothetical protein
MKYSRKYLTEIDERQKQQSGFDQEFSIVVKDLMLRHENNIPLSLAEEDFICAKMSILKTGDGDGEYLFDVRQLNGCKNYLFRNTFLLYAFNLNGHKPAFDIYREIPLKQRQEDAALLEREHQRWKMVLDSAPTNDPIIESSKVEYQHQLLELERDCARKRIGGFYRDYLEKAIVLHSLFYYFVTKEYFEEIHADKEQIQVVDKNVIIDSFCYIHILFRHYAESSKDYQAGKTYHFDQNIDYKNIPSFLKDIITKYVAAVNPSAFQRGITFLFNGQPYAIYCSKHGEDQRLVTFYPIGRPKDVAKISTLKKIYYDNNLVFLIP